MLIIAAFPGSGKSFATNLLNERKLMHVLDLDSSKFKKTKHWKQHYVDVVEDIVKENKYDIVFINTYTEIMDELRDRNIEFDIVVPFNTPADNHIASYEIEEQRTIKEILFGRYILRDHSYINDYHGWMSAMLKNYDRWSDNDALAERYPNSQLYILTPKYSSILPFIKYGIIQV